MVLNPNLMFVPPTVSNEFRLRENGDFQTNISWIFPSGNPAYLSMAAKDIWDAILNLKPLQSGRTSSTGILGGIVATVG